MTLIRTGLLAIVLTLPFSSFAGEGNGSSGGGDPDVVEFLADLKTIERWLMTTDIGINESSLNLISKNVQTLLRLMDDSSETPVLMVDEELQDASGAPKLAIFQTTPLRIKINRRSWQTLSQKEKLVLAALEIFGISGIRLRYDLADLVNKNFPKILSLTAIIDQKWGYQSAIKISNRTSYEAPGIYLEGSQVYPMAANLGAIDVDFENKVIGKMLSGEFCKALGHARGVNVNFYIPTEEQNPIGAFFKNSEGYLGLRQMVLRGYQPDLAVKFLTCE